MPKKFNIRVYGLLVRQERVLLVDEIVQGRSITKFPGGGLELGEGPIDCLIREFKEETNIDIRILKHLYTTDFFQPSVFNGEDQIICIYYQVTPLDAVDPDLDISPAPGPANESLQRFRWKPLAELKIADLTLPIDRHLITNIETLDLDT